MSIKTVVGGVSSPTAPPISGAGCLGKCTWPQEIPGVGACGHRTLVVRPGVSATTPLPAATSSLIDSPSSSSMRPAAAEISTASTSVPTSSCPPNERVKGALQKL